MCQLLQSDFLTLQSHLLALQGKFKANKFTSKHRGPLLSALYHCIALASANNLAPVATKILGYVYCIWIALRSNLKQLLAGLYEPALLQDQDMLT